MNYVCFVFESICHNILAGPTATMSGVCILAGTPTATMSGVCIPTGPPTAKVFQVCVLTGTPTAKVSEVCILTGSPTAKVSEVCILTGSSKAKVSEVCILTGTPTAKVSQVCILTGTPTAKCLKFVYWPVLPQLSVWSLYTNRYSHSYNVCSLYVLLSLMIVSLIKYRTYPTLDLYYVCVIAERGRRYRCSSC